MHPWEKRKSDDAGQMRPRIGRPGPAAAPSAIDRSAENNTRYPESWVLGPEPFSLQTLHLPHIRHGTVDNIRVCMASMSGRHVRINTKASLKITTLGKNSSTELPPSGSSNCKCSYSKASVVLKQMAGP